MDRDAPRLSPAGQAIVAQGADKRAAADLLRERGIPFRKVVRADPYAITFTSKDGEVLTAWTVWMPDREELLVWSEPGLPAFAGGVRPGA